MHPGLRLARPGPSWPLTQAAGTAALAIRTAVTGLCGGGSWARVDSSLSSCTSVHALGSTQGLSEDVQESGWPGAGTCCVTLLTSVASAALRESQA